MLRFKNWQTDCDSGALADAAVQLHFAAVKVRAAFDQEQSESSAGTRANVAAAVETLEELLLVLLRDANTVIPNGADSIGSIAFQSETHGRPGFRIFHGIGQEICKDMTEQL